MSKHAVPPGGAFMPAILRRLAPQLEAEVFFEPEHEIVGWIRFPNGRQSYFWHNKFNLNSVVSARIAQDKGYATFFLRQRGFRVPRTGVFFSDAHRERMRCGQGEAAARQFAEELGWDVFIKPLRGSQGDRIVRTCNAAEFDAVIPSVFAQDRKVLVQETCPGRDYRIVILDGEAISAYERIPLCVCGDARRSIAELLAAKQAEFDAEGRDTIIPLADPRIAMTLRREAMELGTVLPRGRVVRLLDVANLSCGGMTEVVSALHSSVQALAAEISSALDLRYAGVDILMPDATKAVEEYTVLEVNSAPGLDHYASHGPRHDAHIDALYLKVLQAIERGPR
jgi:glutathione synthase/RimK-type ligase-like ATP-grasp enzyme